MSRTFVNFAKHQQKNVYFRWKLPPTGKTTEIRKETSHFSVQTAVCVITNGCQWLPTWENSQSLQMNEWKKKKCFEQFYKNEYTRRSLSFTFQLKISNLGLLKCRNWPIFRILITNLKFSRPTINTEAIWKVCCQLKF